MGRSFRIDHVVSDRNSKWQLVAQAEACATDRTARSCEHCVL